MNERARKIRTTPDARNPAWLLEIGGWLNGKHTYLWFGDENGFCVGTLSGQKLLRLAKAIVRQMDKAK